MASRISASVICSTSCGTLTAPIPFSFWISLRPDLGCGGGTERKFHEHVGFRPIGLRRRLLLMQRWNAVLWLAVCVNLLAFQMLLGS